MPTRIKLIKTFTGMLLTSNAFAYIWMTFFPPPAPQSSMPQIDLLRRGSSIFSQPFEHQRGLKGHGEEKQCMKRFVLFGMRQHWLEFCNYPEYSHYKHAIKFPRSINCTETKCSVMLNYTREPREIRGYDVVIFTDVYEWMTPEMWDWAHGNRTAGQRWVMISEESPLYGLGVQPPAKYGNNTFDWFDSYKMDSDFVHPYGYYEPFGDVKPPEEDLRKFLQPKRPVPGRTPDSWGLVAWMASHCETLQWNRTFFVEDLGKILSIDRFGKCGDEPVVWNNDQKIFEVLGKYKFYLSLENSCCDDYVTEKFWRALKMGNVPIVVGAPLEYYVKVAPPNSFIHVDQFDSIAELAAYILELNGDDSKYLEYFKWRREGRLVSYGQVEHYIRPLTNQTQCDVLKKLLKTDPYDKSKLDYFGDSWIGSCRKCSAKSWLDKYIYPENHSRRQTDLWA